MMQQILILFTMTSSQSLGQKSRLQFAFNGLSDLGVSHIFYAGLYHIFLKEREMYYKL